MDPRAEGTFDRNDSQDSEHQRGVTATRGCDLHEVELGADSEGAAQVSRVNGQSLASGELIRALSQSDDRSPPPDELAKTDTHSP